MKKSFKKVLALVLALVMISSTFSAFAAELNQDAVAKHYGQYKNYLLLGDSVASGYRDEMSDNDEAFNEANKESTYYRVPGSYADVLANAIIEDGSMTALAAPGYRTIEMRYMLEDDYAAACTDEYLFHTSHLYVYEDEVCDCHGVNLLPGSEHFRDEFKKSITDADLITLGVGGNDWGAYLSWLIADIIEKANPADEYIAMVEEILEGNITDISTLEKLVEIAHLAGALPELAQTLPSALEYGLSNFYNNWDIMIQDIYDLNPDVTLMVLGMSDNSLKGKHYDYNGVVGEDIPSAEEEDPAKAQIMSTIIGFIMTIGNTPMIEGAKKFGYTYVDTDGTSYVDSHPDADGHVFIANKIIEALPDPEVFGKYEDVTTGHKHYNDIEYVLLNGIMSATSETTFSPDDALTKGQLAEAFNAMLGTDDATDSTAEVKTLELVIALMAGGAKKGVLGFFKGYSIAVRLLFDNVFEMGSSVTRAKAAKYFRDFNEI